VWNGIYVCEAEGNLTQRGKDAKAQSRMDFTAERQRDRDAEKKDLLQSGKEAKMQSGKEAKQERFYCREAVGQRCRGARHLDYVTLAGKQIKVEVRDATGGLSP
jgi:hypothetical protein